MGNFLSCEENREILGCLYLWHSRQYTPFLCPFMNVLVLAVHSSQTSQNCVMSTICMLICRKVINIELTLAFYYKYFYQLKKYCICVTILKCVQYVLICQENFPDVPESRRAALPLVLVTDLHRTAPVRWQIMINQNTGCFF